MNSNSAAKSALKPRFIRAALVGCLCAVSFCGQAAAPSISKISLLPTRQLELQLAVDPGESYIFEVSTNMLHWMPVGGINNAPASTVTVVNEDTVDLAPAVFVRLKVGRYTRYSFGFMHFADAGQFQGTSLTPAVSLPVSFKNYSAWFEAEGDEPWPEVATVSFSGPAGSNLSGTPASTDYSSSEEGWYMSPNVSTTFGAPQGSWTVNYRGTNHLFTSNLDILSHLVLPVPSVVISGGLLQSVSWVYRDRASGALLSSAPAYMKQIMVQVEGATGRLYDSPDGGSPVLTSHVLLEPVAWSNVTAVTLAYDDEQDNHFVLFYQKR